MNEYITQRYKQFLEDLETIVNIDSGSQNLAGIQKVAEFFETRFAALGWSARIHHFSEEYGGCLEVSNVSPSSNNIHYDLLCVGHMDTVFPEGTAAKWPFSISGNRAKGPGISDMKAGLVSVLHAMETLQHFGIAENLSFCIAFNGDEEIGSPASKTWIESLAHRSERVFVFEPRRATGHFVLQRKGGGCYLIRCYGKASHAGASPENGRNAIIELAHHILTANTFGNPEIETTVNVTKISGGSAGNVIPDYAQAECDVRVSQPGEVERIDKLFKQLERQTNVEGVRVQVEGGIDRPPMVPTEATLQLWERLVEIGEQLDLEIQWKASGGGSDGNFTAALGIPTIDAVGPRGGNSHSFEEYLDLESLIPTVQLICNTCAVWAKEESCE